MIKSLTSVYVMFEFRLIRAAERFGLQVWCGEKEWCWFRVKLYDDDDDNDEYAIE